MKELSTPEKRERLPKYVRAEIEYLYAAIRKLEGLVDMHEGRCPETGIAIVPGGDERHAINLLPHTTVRFAKPGTPDHWGVYVELDKRPSTEGVGLIVRNNNGGLVVRPVVANVVAIAGEAF